MIYDSKAKFATLKEISKYIRVNEIHPLEIYLGLDQFGNKTLRLNENFEPQNVKSSAKIVIQQVKTQEYNSIMFINSGDDDIFYSFCNDLICTSTNCNVGFGYKFLLNRYTKWKKMFASNNSILSQNELSGLIAELLFLKDISIQKYGVRDAIMGWSGQEPTHKDFSYGDIWFEIKSLEANKSSLIISSLEQLDSIVDGMLVVYRLEKMSASFDGISLNSLIANIKDLILDEECLDIFENKLIQAGYYYNVSYDEFVFCNMSMQAYVISQDFPRLQRTQLPNSILSVKYELSLNAIEGFKTNI
ncbi:MAG: PD-(D/E)XK motif protein [Firmicutes bacterium]|nr:PD-(D/E)XK motif protein [Bacillota bacterium]MCL1954244.1 PD-(D/E)XK motif protein [Bacillota bacterium]